MERLNKGILREYFLLTSGFELTTFNMMLRGNCVTLASIIYRRGWMIRMVFQKRALQFIGIVSSRAIEEKFSGQGKWRVFPKLIAKFYKLFFVFKRLCEPVV